MTTTFRADMREAIVGLLEAQKTATPELLKKALGSRPGTFGELPCAYLVTAPERITYDAGTRTRTTIWQVQLVDAYTTSEQTASRLDRLADALVDRFTDAVQVIPNTILQLTEINPNEIESVHPKSGQSTWYPGLLLTFDRTSIREGRQ